MVEVDVVVVDESGSVVVVVDDVDVEVDVVDVVDEVVVDDVVDDVEVVVDVVVGDGGHPWPAKVPLRCQSSVPFQRMVTDQVWSWGCDHGKAAWKLPVVVQSSSSSARQSCATPSITTVRTLPGCGHVARSTLRCGQFGLTTPEPFAGNVVGGNVDVEVDEVDVVVDEVVVVVELVVGGGPGISQLLRRIVAPSGQLYPGLSVPSDCLNGSMMSPHLPSIPGNHTGPS